MCKRGLTCQLSNDTEDELNPFSSKVLKSEDHNDKSRLRKHVHVMYKNENFQQKNFDSFNIFA